MTTPTVSVLMPVYNAERYVAEAVESVLAQTFADFEFLIVDDGSTDGSRAILERFAARDPRVKLTSRPNTGYVVALNEMLAQARGEFIARMDADDICLPERFTLQVAYLRANPDHALVGGAKRDIDERGRVTAILPEVCDDAAVQRSLLIGNCIICHPTVMMQRRLVVAVGGYRDEMHPAEDHDLWLRLGETGKLANLQRVVLHYRVHPDSVSSRFPERAAERSRLACLQASTRRGIAPLYQPQEVARPTGGRRSRCKFSVKYGWWAFMAGNRSAAVRFALRSILLVPWSEGGWRLLACALVKPMPRPADLAGGG